LNLPSYRLADKPEFRLTHRFLGDVGKQYFFGLDVGANISLGAELPLANKWTWALYRSRFDQEYGTSLKLPLYTSQTDSVLLLGGVTTRTDSSIVRNSTSWIGQLIYTRFIDEQLYVSLIPSFVTATDRNDSDPAQNDTSAVGAVIGYKLPFSSGLLKELEFVGEVVPVASGYHLKYPAFAVGVTAKTYGHFFSILLTNTYYSTPASYIIGNNVQDTYLAFNLIRKF
jgi:hypothetical protein